MNKGQRELMVCLIEREIESNEDVISDTEGEERKCWENENSELQSLREVLI